MNAVDRLKEVGNINVYDNDLIQEIEDIFDDFGFIAHEELAHQVVVYRVTDSGKRGYFRWSKGYILQEVKPHKEEEVIIYKEVY